MFLARKALTPLRQVGGATKSSLHRQAIALRPTAIGATGLGPLAAEQKRELSFFSNLLGFQSKREEKAKEDLAKLKKELKDETGDKAVKGDDEKAGKKETDIKLEAKRRRRERIKEKKQELKDELRIVGGSYPTRGPPMPPKRLQEWKHVVENMTISPKKLNLVAKVIRRMTVEDARLQLRYSNKAVSKDVLLALDKALIAAEKSGFHPKDLIVGQRYVGGKIAGKRIDFKARGKSGTILKRVSHLNIILYQNPSLVKGFKSKLIPSEKYALYPMKPTKEGDKKRSPRNRATGSPELRKGVFMPIPAHGS